MSDNDYKKNNDWKKEKLIDCCAKSLLAEGVTNLAAKGILPLQAVLPHLLWSCPVREGFKEFAKATVGEESMLYPVLTMAGGCIGNAPKFAIKTFSLNSFILILGCGDGASYELKEWFEKGALSDIGIIGDWTAKDFSEWAGTYVIENVELIAKVLHANPGDTMKEIMKKIIENHKLDLLKTNAAALALEVSLSHYEDLRKSCEYWYPSLFSTSPLVPEENKPDAVQVKSTKNPTDFNQCFTQVFAAHKYANSLSFQGSCDVLFLEGEYYAVECTDLAAQHHPMDDLA